MKYPLFLFFVLASMILWAQERYIDDLFEVKDPVTEVYAIKDGEELKLDIYSPLNDSLQARPLILFMHGGGFSGGSRSHESLINFARAAARKGYVTVQLSYRLTRKGKSFGCEFEAEGKMETFRNAAEDFMDAVQFMLKNKSVFKIDPSKVIVGGSSAGAEAVLNAVYNERLMFQDLSKYKNVEFAGVFSLAGAVVDARYITPENAVPGAFFHGTDDNLVPYGSAPHHWCDRDKPGYIMLDGSQSIVNRLQELQSSYLFYSFQGGKHEHSGVPFDRLPEVFRFFDRVFLRGERLQIHFSIPAE